MSVNCQHWDCGRYCVLKQILLSQAEDICAQCSGKMPYVQQCPYLVGESGSYRCQKWQVPVMVHWDCRHCSEPNPYRKHIPGECRFLGYLQRNADGSPIKRGPLCGKCFVFACNHPDPVKRALHRSCTQAECDKCSDKAM